MQNTLNSKIGFNFQSKCLNIFRIKVNTEILKDNSSLDLSVIYFMSTVYNYIKVNKLINLLKMNYKSKKFFALCMIFINELEVVTILICFYLF